MASYNGTEIVQNGLVLLVDAANPKSYNVGIATTAWNDLSGNGNNGSLIGGVGYDDRNSGSLRFDGVNDTVSVIKPNPNIVGYITMSIWLKFNSYTSSPIIIHKGNHYTLFMRYLSGRDYWSYADSSNYSYANFGYRYAPGLYETNTWMNLCVVKETSNDVKLYKNGTLLDTRTNFGSALTGANSTLWITGYSDSDSTPSLYLLDGNIAQVSIYNRALAAEEVLQNYNALKSRFVQPSPKVVDDGLILYLDAADVDSYPAFGTIWTDLSGRGNNGTLDNGVGYSNEFGGALTFDGVNDSVTIADNFDFRNTFPSGNFTLTSVSKSTDTTTYPKSSHPFWIQNYALSINTPANKGMSSGDGSNATYFTIEASDGTNYANGSINHIVNVSTVYHRSFVVDRSNGFTARYYVNGNLLGEIKLPTVTGTIYTTGGMSFGNMYGWMFNGSLYRLSVHNKALTSTEVLQNYNAVKGKFGI